MNNFLPDVNSVINSIDNHSSVNNIVNNNNTLINIDNNNSNDLVTNSINDDETNIADHAMETFEHAIISIASTIAPNSLIYNSNNNITPYNSNLIEDTTGTTSSYILNEELHPRCPEELHCVIIQRNATANCKGSNSRYKCKYCSLVFIGGPQKIRVHLTGERENRTRLSKCPNCPHQIRESIARSTKANTQVLLNDGSYEDNDPNNSIGLEPRSQEEVHMVVLGRNTSIKSRSSNSRYKCKYCNYRFIGGPQKIRVHLTGRKEGRSKCISCKKVSNNIKIEMMKRQKGYNGSNNNYYKDHNNTNDDWLISDDSATQLQSDYYVPNTTTSSNSRNYNYNTSSSNSNNNDQIKDYNQYQEYHIEGHPTDAIEHTNDSTVYSPDSNTELLKFNEIKSEMLKAQKELINNQKQQLLAYQELYNNNNSNNSNSDSRNSTYNREENLNKIFELRVKHQQEQQQLLSYQQSKLVAMFGEGTTLPILSNNILDN